MVATIAALSNAGAAASYYEADDYYSEDGLAPSEWQGEGARVLGLDGPVERGKFKALLEGQIGYQQLGTVSDGALAHRPGWDMTLSAPKSVSIMALVAGDKRLVEVHGQAVKTAMALVEQHMAATRIREDNAIRREATGNLIIASFQHNTSRAQDPQLHNHNVILNATRDAQGQWRSLEPRALYQLQKQIGAIYRQELAAQVKALGYEIVTAKDSTFEIAGISEQALDAFSQRTADINAKLEERGTSADKAGPIEKQIATLETRAAKEHISQLELTSQWRERAADAGFDSQARMSLIATAETRAGNSAATASETAFARELAADKAVAHGMAALGERQSVFAETALAEKAGQFGIGAINHHDIAAAIARASQDGELQSRSFIDRRGAEFAGFTTATNIAHEEKLLGLETQGRVQVAPFMSPLQAAIAIANAERQSRAVGHDWNDDQRSATQQILTSRNQIIGLQGAAGTAKTSTVLATVAQMARDRGIDVTALAPTASAAQVLGNALDAHSDTVARHLLSPSAASAEDKLWIVDEASLLSARDTAKLFTLAEKHQARVLLTGDTQQLGSIGAGAAFHQLQSAGMETAHLSEIVRQTDSAAKDAVIASLEGDARKALTALDQGKGKLLEHADRDTRFTQIAHDYAALDVKSRHATLVIEPSREGRDQLTTQIRAELVRNGALGAEAINGTQLVARDLTRAEAKDARNYDIGDVIRFTKDYADKGIAKTQGYRVAEIDAAKSSIRLDGKDGQSIDWRLRQWGAAKSQAFTAQPIELRIGDRLQFTRNDRQQARINGMGGVVTTVDTANQSATLRLANGKTQRLEIDTIRDQHIRHAYVETAFAAQGRTADHVMVHADSKASNLIDQRSFYVAISRAKESISLYTDDRAKLIGAIHERSGTRQMAMEQSVTDQATLPIKAASKSIGAGLE